MSEQIAKKQLTPQKFFSSELVRAKFQEVLGKNANSFIASLMATVNNNDLLQKAEPQSIMTAAMTAAALGLPINQNLGFAYIIPYKTKIKGKDGNADTWVTVAQFQMGYKGFIQLSQRTGQFKTVNVSDVKDGEIKSIDRLTGKINFDWKIDGREKLPTIGFVAYFELKNGFSKSSYMSVTDLKSHGLRYSQTMKKGYGLWVDNFDAMGAKTVIKLLLSKYAPMQTEQMQTAVLADQAIIGPGGDYEYPDNKPVDNDEMAQDKEDVRIKKFITDAKTPEELEKCRPGLTDETSELYNAKMDELIKQSGKEVS